MLKFGEYEYPNKITFSEAIDVAKTAIADFGGKMSNKDVAVKLGYKIKNPNSISGYIFRKFDDICSYALMKRERGFLYSTDIAVEATDPYDSRKAEEGKSNAIRQMAIVMKAYETWNGQIPQETALPAKLTEIFNVSWQEAQKHSDSLRKLFIDVFPYIKPVTEYETKNNEIYGTGLNKKMTTKEIPSSTGGSVIGELRTAEYGVLKIKDVISIDIALKILQSLKKNVSVIKEEQETQQE